MRFPRSIILPAVVGLVAGVVLAAAGVQGEYAWGWAALAAAIAFASGLRMPDDPRSDAPGRETDPERVGSEVSRLAWAINMHTDTVNEAVTRRVRATLRRRLLRRGIDIDDEQQAHEVERLLGAGLWARLNGRRTKVADLRDAIAAAAHLATPGTEEPAQRPMQRETP